MGYNYFSELIGDDGGINELFDIDPDRADLVGFPAIGRKFLLIKSNKQEDFNMNEILMGLTEQVLKNEDIASQAVSTLDKLEKSVTDGLATEVDVTGLLSGLEEALREDDEVSTDSFDVWNEKAGEFIDGLEALEDDTDDEEIIEDEVIEDNDSVEEVAEENEEVEEEEIVEDEIVEDEVIEDEIVPEEEIEVEDEAADVQKSLKEQISKQALELKEAKVELKKAQEGIESLRIEKQRKDFVIQASEELSYLAKSADEVGDLLMSLKLAGVPEETFDGIYSMFKSNNEMIKKSGFFNEFGTSIDAEDDDDPEVSLMKSAKGLVTDGKFNTVEQAFVSLLREDPAALHNE